MNDYAILLNYLRNNQIYCFRIEDYILPKYINQGLTNLEKARNQELQSKKSSFVKNFELSLKTEISKSLPKKNKELYLRNIPEFIIPIENKELWRDLLKLNGVESTNAAWNVKYFKLDYLFPYLDLCVEIDSNFHFPKIKYDRARDMYLSNMYRMKTTRLLNFGETPENKKKNLEILRENFNPSNLSVSPMILDFSKSIVEGFVERNQVFFSFLTKVRKSLGDKFLSDKEILVPLEDWVDDFSELGDVKIRENILENFKLIFLKDIKFKEEIKTS